MKIYGEGNKPFMINSHGFYLRERMGKHEIVDSKTHMILGSYKTRKRAEELLYEMRNRYSWKQNSIYRMPEQ